MIKLIILLITITFVASIEATKSNYFLANNKNTLTNKLGINKTETVSPKLTSKSLKKIKKMLHKEAGTLNTAVINKALRILHCAKKHEIEHKNILTIIDYSLPSNKKRLWVFDLTKNKLLFHTYVSHGIKSGTLSSKYFSNKPNSKASSIGVYNTEKAYRGRHGKSLKLYGLDKGFNDNAYNRFIVMHGSWYVNEKFIKKYGRAGRSWGCPTLPRNLTKPIIETIKNKAILVMYYPKDKWLHKSKFLNCSHFSGSVKISKLVTQKQFKKEKEQRGKIFFADINNNNKREVNEPIVVVSADNYQRIFNAKAPLKRMLRRQINHTEYVALNDSEIRTIDEDNNSVLNKSDKEYSNNVYFVIPEVKLKRGYYATEMKIITLGKVKKIKLNTAPPERNQQITNHTIHFESKPAIQLKSTTRFIRWLGL